VTDAQAAAGRAREPGGAVLVPPTSTAVGDIAVASDPVGASFGVFAGDTEP
jgi:predicted enzyme related to lactoylglutathione lyase